MVATVKQSVSHFEYCKNTLLQDREQAFFYVTFQRSFFNFSEELEIRYYKLTSSEKKELTEFFTTQNKTSNASNKFPYRVDSVPKDDLCNQDGIYQLLQGKKNYKDIERMTVSLINKCTDTDNAFRLLTNLKWIHGVKARPFNVCLEQILLLSKKRMFDDAQQILLLMSKLNVKPDLITCTNFLKVYTECKQFDAAKQFLIGMNGKKSQMAKFGLTPNIVHCSAYLKICAQTGHFEEAKRFLLSPDNDNMQKRWPNAAPKIVPNNITCNNFLMVCVVCKQFEVAKQLLFGVGDKPSLMEQWGLIPDIRICNAFIEVCSKTGHFDEAKRFLFGAGKDNMQRRWSNAHPPIYPNAITCINYLWNCANAKKFDDAKQFLFGVNGAKSQMAEFGLIPNISHYSIYIVVCGQTGHFKEAERIMFSTHHDHMQTKSLRLHPEIVHNDLSCTNFIMACAICKQFKVAKRFLIGMNGKEGQMTELFGLQPNIKHCSAYLNVCAETERFEEAERFLLSPGNDNMQRRWPNARPKIFPDLITCTDFLKVCLECKQFQAAKQFVLGVNGGTSEMAKLKLIPDIAICNILIQIYGKTGYFDEAKRFLLGAGHDNMQNKWPTASPKIHPDPTTCLNYLMACAECGQFDAAKQFLIGDKGAPSEMSQLGLIPDINHCNTFIMVCGKTGHFDEAKRFLLGTGNDNMQNKWPTAYRKIYPDHITCLHYIMACGDNGQFAAAKQFLIGEEGVPSQMSQLGLIPNLAICSAYVTVCAKTMQFDEAYSFLFSHHANNMITLWPSACPSIFPDPITCLNYLMVCTECKKFDAAKQFLIGEKDKPSQMNEWNLIPNIAHCNIYITACGQTGHFDEAKRFLLGKGNDNMQNKWPSANPNIYPNHISCLNYLMACFDCDQFDAATQFLLGIDGNESQMTELGLEPNIAHCNVYLEICGKFKRFSEANHFMTTIIPMWELEANHITHSLFAIVDSDQFEQILADGVSSNIYLSNLGLNEKELNFHVNSIFKNGLFPDVREAVPLEFAKKLFQYHFSRGVKVEKIVTGFHLGTKLRDEFKSFLLSNYHISASVDDNNLGKLILENDTQSTVN